MTISGKMAVLLTLGAILVFGIGGTVLILEKVPFFLIVTAIVLMILFPTAIPLTISKTRIGLVLNMVIGLVVILGNSASATHIQIMLSFEKPVSSMILLVGGYVLQPLLIVLSVIELSRKNPQLRR